MRLNPNFPLGLAHWCSDNDQVEFQDRRYKNTGKTLDGEELFTLIYNDEGIVIVRPDTKELAGISGLFGLTRVEGDRELEVIAEIHNGILTRETPSVDSTRLDRIRI